MPFDADLEALSTPFKDFSVFSLLSVTDLFKSLTLSATLSIPFSALSVLASKSIIIFSILYLVFVL